MTNQIDPKQVTDFNRTLHQLQVFAIFSVCVAGKNADQVAAKVTKLLSGNKRDELPLDYLAKGYDLRNTLAASKIGQYDRIERAIKGLAKLNLQTCTLRDLVAIHGISYKTATFFLLHSREDFEGVVLDTHVLRYVREKYGDGETVPGSSPRAPEIYEMWSKIAAQLYRSEFGDSLSLAQIDLIVWKRMSGRDDD